MTDIMQRMDLAEFFALPDSDPDYEGIPSGFGLAGLKTEGAPLYRDQDGYYWSLQIGRKGSLWRAMA